MTKRALIVASETEGLTGADLDASRMARALETRGFAIDLRKGRAATRAGILAGFGTLIERSAAGDAALFYYSGHGGRFINPDPREGLPGAGQFIVPTDYSASTDDDFRGITAWELTLEVARLTAKIDNVAVLFDCCHSAQMSRSASTATVRALPHPFRLGIERYLAALAARGARFESLDPLGNPNAVRLFAAAETQSAWEYTSDQGIRTGAFTEAVLWALEQARAGSFTWELLARVVRERVTRRFPDQWPEAAGPLGREVFSTHVPLRSNGVTIVAAGDEVVIRAGRLLGVQPGDTYRVLPPGAQQADAIRGLATAQVVRVGQLQSVVSVTRWPLPDGSLAFPEQEHLARLSVSIQGASADADALRRRVDASSRLRCVDDGEADLIVRVGDGVAAIMDHAGDLFPSIPLEGDIALERVVSILGDFAVADSLRALVGAHGVPESCATVTWGLVIDGKGCPLPDTGALVGLGDRLFVRIENRSKQTIYAHVFNVGLRGKVTRLTTAAMHGVPLQPSESYTLGEVEGAGLQGLSVRWPADMPQAAPRLDQLYVIATSQPVDLGVLESANDRARRAIRARGGSSLQLRFAQLHLGGARDSEPPDVQGFAIARRAYYLSPTSVAFAGPTFLVDDDPGGVRAATVGHAWEARPRAAATPSRVAIRLEEVIVHSNRALGSADVRVDFLALTRAGKESSPYLAGSMRFPGVRDGDRLAVDRGLLFHGEVIDFVDLCLWISRDRAQSENLMNLIEQRVSSPQVQAALATLVVGNLPWAAAVGGALALVRMAHDALVAAAGTTIGLYRTSFLASERFGVGRHPRAGYRRAKDFSFAISVEEVE